MKLSELKPNPRNPRSMSESKAAMLKKSLDEFGDLSGIVYNRVSETLIGGHQRAKVSPDDSQITIVTEYKKPTRTGTVAEGFVDIDGERFSYREVLWDKKKEKAANIAANKGAGQWDYPLLTEWLNELDAENIDMDLTMFDKDELERIMGGWDVGIDEVLKTEENLDGLESFIKIKCPQDSLDEVKIYLKSKLLETSFTGVEVV